MTNPSPNPAVRLPTRNMLSDEVYQLLREQLLSHRIPAGSRLNLDELARQLHVSNTPVRQALAQLLADGFVAHTPYRGFTAAPLLDREQMRERYEFRIIVEPAAAALAAQRRTGDEVAHILELTDTDRISAALDGGDNEDEILMEGDSRLHQAVTRASHNSLLCSQLDPVFLRMREYGTYRNRDSLRRAWEEHREIVLAIHRRDASAAFAAMHTHLTNAVERFQTAFSIKSD